MLTLYRNNPLLFFVAIVGSFILSAWGLYIDPVINRDGIRYVTVASEFMQGQWQQGFELYKWSFYPLLVAFVAKVLSVGTVQAAHIINALFAALLCLSFVCTIRELGGNKRVLIFATILILCLPSVNKYRPFITRDMGYLACYMWSLYYIVRFTNTRNIIYLVAWSLCTILCLLFRIEAIALLCIIPLLLIFFKTTKVEHKALLILAITVVSVLLSAGLAMWLFSEEAQISSQLMIQQPMSSINEIWLYIKQQINFRLLVIEQDFLGEFSKGYAKTVLVVTLFVMVAYETLRRLAFVYALMAWHALKQNLVFTKPLQYKLWWAFVIIHFAVLCVFTFGKMFVVSRYTMALVLTILLLAPFSADYFWQQWQKKQNRTVKWLVPAFVFVFCITSLKGLDRWSTQKYIKDAGVWVAQNIESDARIYSNETRFLFFANRESIRTNLHHDWSETMRLIRSKTLEQDFDYMAVKFNSDRMDQKQRFDARFAYKPIKTFKNYKNNMVVIYKLSDEHRK